MGKLVVSDANIFIDLIAMGFIGDFFQLPYDIMTVDFIMRELKKSGQKEIVRAYETRKKLTIRTFSSDEIDKINALRESAEYKVSVQDCSIWFCAKTSGAAILTGDKALTVKARGDGIEVHGLLFILDKLVEQNIIPPSLASEKLSELTSENKRLPEKLVKEFIFRWGSLMIFDRESDY